MKIIELHAENFKRLRVVQFEANGSGVIEVGGKNAQGKTSTLDAIQAALGRIGKETTQPIRSGETRAEVRIDLGDLVVKRTWTASRSVLKVTTPEGHSIQDPAALLRKLVGKIAFDPLEFAESKPDDQVKQLLAVLDSPVDLDELEAKRKHIYEERTGLNREVKALTARLAGRPIHDPTLPKETVPASKLASALAHADLSRSQLEILRRRKGDLLADIEQLKRQLAATEAELEQINQEGRELSRAVREQPSADELSRQLEKIEETNQKVIVNNQTAELREELRRMSAAAEGCTAGLEEVAKVRRDALAAAGLPELGVEFDESGVTLNGVPFTQASGAERLRISTLIAMKANPEIRVISIRDGSLLDSDSMAVLREFAGRHDFQIWIERVKDSPDGAGLYIEDGEARAD